MHRSKNGIALQIPIRSAPFIAFFSPFKLRGNGKTESTFAVQGGALLDFLEWGQSDRKSQGQINGVVFGCGLFLSV